MTSKLFWTDPYATQCDATVIGTGVDWVELDRTVFFAECGGQESDHGTIADLPVRRATLHDDGRIVYALTDLDAWAEQGLRRSTSDPGKGVVHPAKRLDGYTPPVRR